MKGYTLLFCFLIIATIFSFAHAAFGRMPAVVEKRTVQERFDGKTVLKVLRTAGPESRSRKLLQDTSELIDVDTELYYDSVENAESAAQNDLTTENIQQVFTENNVAPPNVTSAPVVSNVSTDAGSFGCSSNTYLDMDSGICVSCPTGASSAAGSVGNSSCQCATGAYMKDGECKSCPFYSTSAAGSDEIGDCVCSGGTFLDISLETCQPCSKGFFCPGNNSQIDCNTALPTESSQCHIPLTTATDFADTIGQCTCQSQGA